jgi:hypothetical protein
MSGITVFQANVAALSLYGVPLPRRKGAFARSWCVAGCIAAFLCLLAGCGGGSGKSSPTPTDNPLPTITSLSPGSGNAGATAQVLTINGTNFLSTSTVSYNSVVHTATFVSSTQLTISLSASDQATGGNYAVTVTNPAPGGGASDAVNFTVNNPTPIITSFSPSAASAGGSPEALSINGSNFLSSSTVTFNAVAHTATFVSAAQLTIQLTSSDLATAGTYSVVVTNPTPGGGPASGSFSVDNPIPVVSSVSPNVIATGSPSTAITVTGSNFVASSQILLNGNSTSTTFVSSTELTAEVPAASLSSATPISVAVANASPGGGTSSAVALQLVSVASLSMLATPSTPTSPEGPWNAFVVALGSSGNPLAGLPFAITASEGTLSVSEGVTDQNGAFSTTVTPPAGIGSSEAVGLVATIGGQSVSASISFTAISSSAIRSGNSASALRAKLGIMPAATSAASSSIIPAAIGISTAAPGSTSQFAGPSNCYTPIALFATPTTQCVEYFQAQNISLQPSNAFQATCNAANVASTALNVAECIGTAVTVVSCAVSVTGVGSVATGGAADVVCAATLDLTASTLGPDCAEFILGEVINHFSPEAAAALEVVQLSLEPSTNPLDYIVTLCDIASAAGSQLPGSAVGPVAGGGPLGGITAGPPLSITLNSPTGIAIDGKGNVFFDDDGNNVIRELSAGSPSEVTTYAGSGTAGYSGDNGPPGEATLNHPTQLAFYSDGSLYIADAGNNVVRKITPAGIITTVAGTGVAGYNGDNVLATNAWLNFPDSIALDTQGNLYIADAGNNRIRKVSTSGVITTVAGNGNGGYNGDNLLAIDAELNEPTRVVVDTAGDLFISDLLNNRIREVDSLGSMISTLAGSGVAGFQGDNGPATTAELDNPVSLALDASGDVYIADLMNYRIRVVNRQTGAISVFGVTLQPGDIATVVGGGTQSDVDPGGYQQVSLSFPTGLIMDTVGNLYFADADQNIILRASAEQ